MITAAIIILIVSTAAHQLHILDISKLQSQQLWHTNSLKVDERTKL